ncbi:MAG: non-canonical purine NTP pyrophosphatase [Treponema sp.]|jgi:XTP/dITP diphosphohydrolase|nr:non-canonical purine NTP pyrophosphatase [Treponema sp.]
MTIWLASGNEHKRRELAAIFAGHSLKTPVEGGFTDFDPREGTQGFEENALIKARALYGLLEGAGLEGPVLADDSGLCVDALGGRPGVYSARYGGGKLGDKERNLLLLAELDGALAAAAGSPAGPGTAGAAYPGMAGAATAGRGARFVCAMVFLWGHERYCLVRESLEGVIVSGPGAIRGSGGFGYDPILYLPEKGKTLAELTEEEKNSLSHRGKAGKIIAQLLGR